MFPRFFKEDSAINTNATEQGQNLAASFAGDSSTTSKPWFLNDQGEGLNPDSGITAIGLSNRSKYSKRSFVVADFNPITGDYGVNRLYTTVLIGLAIGTFVIITHGLQSGFGLLGASL
jgi:hypothetical protein